MFTPSQRIAANNKFSQRLSFKSKQNLELSQQIKEYFNEQQINLPQYKNIYKSAPERFLPIEVDTITGEITGEGENHSLHELAMAYYTLKANNMAVYAMFKQGKTQKQQILSALYSRHRLDHIWLYRKSKLIRKIWRDYLNETEIYKHYDPRHLVLTVPHKGGVWMGKRFYARELLKKFNILRKYPAWKKYIHAGEYGMEISKSQGGNGLHIHLHCLVFQNPEYSRNTVQEWIKRKWQQLTEAEYIHYETLYVHVKNQKGQYIRTQKEGKAVKKKYYLEGHWFHTMPDEVQKEVYVKGILEAIKYHFKNDALLNPDETYNIPLIAEVLQHSKYLRMYSKFGGFYGDKRLNYSSLEKPEEEAEYEHFADLENIPEAELDKLMEESYLEWLNDTDEVVEPSDNWQDGPPEDLERAADLNLAVANLVNPYTKQPAGRSEYELYVGYPKNMVHLPGTSSQPFRAKVQHEDNYYKVHQYLSLGTIMRLMATNQYNEMLLQEDFERLREYQSETAKREREQHSNEYSFYQ